MKYLLDTDICIYWLKGRQPVRNRLLAVEWSELGICVITVAELYYGAYKSEQVAKNLARASQFIQNLPVLPLSDNAIRRFGELKAYLERIGQRIEDFDLMIASVALTEGKILVTNNTRHYDRITGLQLENWTLP